LPASLEQFRGHKGLVARFVNGSPCTDAEDAERKRATVFYVCSMDATRPRIASTTVAGCEWTFVVEVIDVCFHRDVESPDPASAPSSEADRGREAQRLVMQRRERKCDYLADGVRSYEVCHFTSVRVTRHTGSLLDTLPRTAIALAASLWGAIQTGVAGQALALKAVLRPQRRQLLQPEPVLARIRDATAASSADDDPRVRTVRLRRTEPLGMSLNDESVVINLAAPSGQAETAGVLRGSRIMQAECDGQTLNVAAEGPISLKRFVGACKGPDVSLQFLGAGGVVAKYVRIYLRSWHVWPAIRVELYGRPLGGQRTRVHAIGLADSSSVPDDSFKASSVYTDSTFGTYPAHGARLHGASAWVPAALDARKVLQIDLHRPHLLALVATQGSPLWDEWVEQYSLSFSMDGRSWHDYAPPGSHGGDLLDGNADRSTVRMHHLWQPTAQAGTTRDSGPALQGSLAIASVVFGAGRSPYTAVSIANVGCQHRKLSSYILLCIDPLNSSNNRQISLDGLIAAGETQRLCLDGSLPADVQLCDRLVGTFGRGTRLSLALKGGSGRAPHRVFETVEVAGLDVATGAALNTLVKHEDRDAIAEFQRSDWTLIEGAQHLRGRARGSCPFIERRAIRQGARGFTEGGAESTSVLGHYVDAPPKLAKDIGHNGAPVATFAYSMGDKCFRGGSTSQSNSAQVTYRCSSTARSGLRRVAKHSTCVTQLFYGEPALCFMKTCTHDAIVFCEAESPSAQARAKSQLLHKYEPEEVHE